MGGNSSFFYTNPTPATNSSISANVSALVAQSQAQLAAYTVVTDTWASTVNINWDLANCHRLTLTGSPTTLTFSGGVDGEKLILELTQDSTGSRLITLPSNVRFSTILPSVILSTSPGYMDKLGFMYNAAANKYDLVAVIYGFI